MKDSDNIILAHYRKVAEAAGLDASATMADNRVRQLETEQICRFVRSALADLMANGRRLEDIVIADVGCGNGFTLDIVSRLKIGPKLIGYEFSPELIALAKQRFVDKPVEIRAADIRDRSTLGPEPIDILICQRVLINLLDADEQKQARDNLIDAMYPGGKLLFIEAFQKNFDLLNRARTEFGLPATNPAHHNRYIEEEFFGVADLIPWGDSSTRIEENFLSTHYYVSRVLHPVLLGDRPFQHNSMFVTFMSQALQPVVGEFSPLRAKVFIRADIKSKRSGGSAEALPKKPLESSAAPQWSQGTALAGDGTMLLFCKDDEWSVKAISAAKTILGDRVIVLSGRRGYPFPEIPPGNFAAILSFNSPWILPKEILDRAALALNFHPGSCEYPGIGCYNFALYENASEYGAVCHHMLSKVDTGTVVMERLFPLSPDDMIETVRNKTLQAMLEMFRDILLRLAKNEELPVSLRQWTRRPFRRIELDQLGRITSDMSDDEMQRRVKAMNYPNYPGAFVEVGNRRFYAANWPARLSSEATNRPFVAILDEILAPLNSSIREVVRRIDRSRIGLALLVDDNRKLIATITDGDVRRALMGGVTFDAPASKLLDFKSISAHSVPIARPISTPEDELLRIMRTADVHHIPLLDDQGRVADLALLSSFIPEHVSKG